MNKKQLARVAIVGAVSLLAFVCFLPSIFMRPAVRNWIVRELLVRHGVDAQIENVTIGWFRPTRVEGVSMGPVDQPKLLRARRISSDRTLWKALMQGIEIGDLSIDRPEIHVWFEEDGSSNLEFPLLDVDSADPKPTPRPSLPGGSLSILVQDAALFIKTPTMPTEASVFDGLDLRGSLRQDEVGRALLIQPGRILDHAAISPELCEGGLKYMVPILAEATWTKGQISIDLDACMIDLDDPKKSLISGKLTIHGIEAGIKNELVASATKQLASLLGRDGLDTVHLADNSVVLFQVRDGLVWHEGVEFGLPRVSKDLVIRTSGSVAFDESLDLTIDVPMPLHLVAGGPIAQALTDKTLTLRARGTLSKPEININDEDLIGKLITSIGSELNGEEHPVQSVMKELRDVLNGAAAAADDTENEESETPLLDRLRERRGDRGGPLRRLFGGTDADHQ